MRRRRFSNVPSNSTLIFAVAYAYLGIMASSTLEPSLSVNYRTRAYELRDRTSEAEKYWIFRRLP